MSGVVLSRPRLRASTTALALLVTLTAGACLAHTRESLSVEVSIASVTLGEDCAADGITDGDCAGECPSLCQQSSLQLRIAASGEGSVVPFEIVSIRVVDPESGSATTIASRNPRSFVDGYIAWDETIAPGDLLDVSYETTAPDWSALTSRSGFGWGTVYRVEMVVLVDGVERTLMADAMREPEIDT